MDSSLRERLERVGRLRARERPPCSNSHSSPRRVADDQHGLERGLCLEPINHFFFGLFRCSMADDKEIAMPRRVWDNFCGLIANYRDDFITIVPQQFGFGDKQISLGFNQKTECMSGIESCTGKILPLFPPIWYRVIRVSWYWSPLTVSRNRASSLHMLALTVLCFSIGVAAPAGTCQVAQPPEKVEPEQHGQHGNQ